MFYRYMIIHQRNLTFPAAFEELKKVKLVEKNIIKAFEAHFRNCQRLNYEDVIFFIYVWLRKTRRQTGTVKNIIFNKIESCFEQNQ